MMNETFYYEYEDTELLPEGKYDVTCVDSKIVEPMNTNYSEPYHNLYFIVNAGKFKGMGFGLNFYKSYNNEVRAQIQSKLFKKLLKVCGITPQKTENNGITVDIKAFVNKKLVAEVTHYNDRVQVKKFFPAAEANLTLVKPVQPEKITINGSLVEDRLNDEIPF
jgi:hypothetical protein